MESRRRNPGFCIFPNYRWCGPGCSGPGAPINDVDACCKKHDLCFRSGRSRCQCDYEFLACLRSKVDYRTEKGKKAALMYGFKKLDTLFSCGDKTRSR